jgi:TDG/mug DNA glycosylase family protein
MLPDVMGPDLRVVFCGTAVGEKSASVGAYYAGPGNQFWPVLHRTGLTPTRLAPAEYPRLLDYALGLTDVCKVRSGSDRTVGTAGFDVQRLVELLERHSPRHLAFNGKKAAKAVLGRDVAYGEQPERIEGVRVLVLPSTSGAARGFWDERYWRELGDMCRA